MSHTFPRSALVYPGCTLAVLVNAIATIDYGLFPYDQWGDGIYTYDGTDGDVAAVTFRGGHLVATLFDHDSNRSPFRCKGKYDVERLFQGLPASHRPLADWCLGCWRDDYRGQDVPLVTAAFWDAGEYLTAAEPWPQVWEHGAHLLKRQLLDNLDEALAQWQDNGALSPDRIALIRSLFQRKMARPDAILVLKPEEVAFLMAIAEEGPEDYEGDPWKQILKAAGRVGPHRNHFEEGCKALESIGIHLP